MDERRISPRKRTFLGAHVRHLGASPPTECIVRDLSETGARLHFAQPVALPDTIDLKIMKTGERFRAKVVWSTRDSFGVRFNAEARSTGLEASLRSNPAVQDVLESARTRIAALIGVKPDMIGLKLELDASAGESLH